MKLARFEVNKSKNNEPAILQHTQCLLGEGPMWHSKRKSCFWTDIEGFEFYEYSWDTGVLRFYKINYRVSLIVECENEREVLLGLQGGIAKLDLETSRFEWILDLEKDQPNHRCNDGACDNMGRLWIGTMDMNLEPLDGSLYCINEFGNVEKKLGKVTISNGMAWSADNASFYYIDTPTQGVDLYTFDASCADIQHKRTVIRIPPEMGAPDGMTIDQEGMLWIAHWGGFGVFRWNPITGKLIDSIRLPVPNITSCVFVGEELDYLLITTARQDLTNFELLKYPHSGDVFIVKTGVKGVPSFKCKI